MGAPIGIDRRDPTSGLIRLGATLADAGRESLTGELRIADQGRLHRVRIVRGIISDVVWDIDGPAAASPAASPRARAVKLFELPRPLVTFDNDAPPTGRLLAVPSEQVVLSGVLRRQDLFDPRPMVERIPVDALRLTPVGLGRLHALRLSPLERGFVSALTVPTPTAMALWKRGLDPRHAAALIVALNLLGCFDAWEAGDLPRPSKSATFQRKLRNAASDHEILGVSPDADAKEIDRAFRRLSFTFHPDRRHALPAFERPAADGVFKGIQEAHARLKHSRRRRPVREQREDDGPARVVRSRARPWLALFREAEAAKARGENKAAAALALKALAADPPAHVVPLLKTLLRQVA